ncbi:hypothetical protein AN216_12680 [Streptomyces oceani]|uniref:Uncharacterized protein n=1 Tax=Streptomyces oceani TaxID=1075402 RepID=A0A1E7KH47_9ACTN|nr:hypothetical protein AN216_12680 [Streptomyces oceani]
MSATSEPEDVSPAPAWHAAGPDGTASELLLRTGRHFTNGTVSEDLRAVYRKGGRAGDVFYRDRWSHDKVVRSTHGVVPPLVMGAIYSGKGSYAIGFMLLSDPALAGCVHAYARMRGGGSD